MLRGNGTRMAGARTGTLTDGACQPVDALTTTACVAAHVPRETPLSRPEGLRTMLAWLAPYKGSESMISASRADLSVT